VPAAVLGGALHPWPPLPRFRRGDRLRSWSGGRGRCRGVTGRQRCAQEWGRGTSGGAARARRRCSARPVQDGARRDCRLARLGSRTREKGRGDGKHLAPAGTASWPRPRASRGWHRCRATCGVRTTGGSHLDAVHGLWVARSPPRTPGLPRRVQGLYAGVCEARRVARRRWRASERSGARPRRRRRHNSFRDPVFEFTKLQKVPTYLKISKNKICRGAIDLQLSQRATYVLINGLSGNVGRSWQNSRPQVTIHSTFNSIFGQFALKIGMSTNYKKCVPGNNE
jgi:hypothetical protein